MQPVVSWQQNNKEYAMTMIIENQDFIQPDNKNDNDKKKKLTDKESYGTQLKSARVARKISVDEIANSLNLETKIIKSIEEMDYKNLPTGAFVCGYIRSYAKILKLDADVLVKDFLDATRASDTHALNMRQAKSRTKITQKINVKYLFAFVLLLVVVSVLYLKTQNTATVSSDIKSEQKSQNEKLQTKATNDVLQKKQSITTKDDITIPITIATPPIDDASVTPKIQDESTNTKKENESTKEDATKKILPNPLPEKLTINITTTDQAWIEIVDRSQRQLHYKLLHADEEINLEGFHPFYLSIGNATTVTIKINGIEFPHREYIRTSGTARFTLDRKSLKMLQKQDG
jgi:cytoskeleton protein RodZ